ncbi:MAG: hypothetical protein V1668_03740 [Patescibacteria group bacterium]
MAVIISSVEAVRIATRALEVNEVIKRTDTFTLYRLPLAAGRPLSNYVLMLFNPGSDLPAGKIPAGLIIPVDINGSNGYLVEESVAQQFQA